MPQITLSSHLVAYNIFTLAVAADKQVPRSCRGLQVQFPASSITPFAANSGGYVLVGRPNDRATPTSISNPELALAEGDSDNYPVSDNNNISLTEKYINASVDNAIVLLDIEQG